MNLFKELFSSAAPGLVKAGLLAVVLILTYYIVRLLHFILKKIVAKTPGTLDDYALGLFKTPVLLFLYWIIIKAFVQIFFTSQVSSQYIVHSFSLSMILIVAWGIIQMVRTGSYFLQTKLNLRVQDNLRARKSLTQIRVFQRILITVIVILAIGAGLMTFPQVRSVGISILTSAGIAGIIIGFAAQKSLGMILAGIQLAITQPIRIDDVVIVEGEWGKIEEITLTYVVVKIWDERRLVLPVNYFLEKPFQNWTRTESQITGSVFLYVDYRMPVDAIRAKLTQILTNLPEWDHRVSNIQVTNTTERFKEIRILVTSEDSSKNWDLRVAVREKLIDFINEQYPGSFARIRVQTLDPDQDPATRNPD